jgi:diguanylate cyclase (GGDEF)-like protein
LLLVVLDIDNFRAFANLHGDAAGDGLLRVLAARLDAEAARSHGRAVRLGADEFAVLIPARGPGDTAASWPRLLLQAACAPFEHRGLARPFSMTAGVARLPEHGSSATVALRCARMAVIQGKREGGGRLVASPPGQVAAAERRDRLARDLPGAIQSGQLIPYYQPVVDARSCTIVGMEVLARWMHPTEGLLEPAAFIAIAEEHKLGCALTCSLMQRAYQDVRAWPQHWYFAFNTSPNDLMGVTEFIRDCWAQERCTAQPSRLELEVTESALMRDLDLSRQVVAMLRPLGVKVVLDDFGTGYANFRQLREIAFSRLKIDKSLVTDVLEDSRAEACVQAIIDLAHNMGMTATAEGVESPAVADRLVAMGCDHAQGYHYGRPMPASDVAWLAGGPSGGGGLDRAA